MTTDVNLRHDDSIFRYRVAGVCLDRERVLLQQIQDTNYWFLPGGHGRLMEMSEESLRRELLEELEVEAEVGRLLWVVENFFRLDGADFHEVGLYYLVQVATGTPLLELEEFNGLDNETPVRNRWHDLDSLDGLNLVPPFLVEALKTLPEHPVHVVDWEDNLPRFPGAPY